ncbi:MAG: BolA family protein [Bdellovibrionales bacterium]
MSRAQRIENSLKNLNPELFELENESDQHAGPPGRETHFKLLMVSAAFEGLSRVDRQRQVYDLLKAELQSGLHALTLRLLTPQEWSNSKSEFQSPACASGTTRGSERKPHG